MLIYFRGMTVRELGLDWQKLPIGLLGTLLLFGGIFLFQRIGSAIAGCPFTWNDAWSGDRRMETLGRWINQIFGNTLFEEVVYRGTLLGQTYLLLGLRFGHRPRWRLTCALILSQGLFAMAHLSINLSNGASLWIFLAQFLSGILFAGLYLFTQNLFLVMGVHTLINNPPAPWTDWINGGVFTGVALLIYVIVKTIAANCRRSLNGNSQFSFECTAAFF